MDGLWFCSDDNRVVWNYWTSQVNACDIYELCHRVDELQIWYPERIDNSVISLFGDIVSFIEGGNRKFGEAIFSKSINLENSEEDILLGFDKTRRYKTKRAMNRDGLEVFIKAPSELKDSDLSLFIDFYNRFASEKGLPHLNEKKVRALFLAKVLYVGEVYKDNNRIVLNAYLAYDAKKIVSLFTSSSLFRSNKEQAAVIGRANGYLHFAAMCYFKKIGFKKYDLGGFYLGNSDYDKVKITNFKREFGGDFDRYETGFIIDTKSVRNVNNNLLKYSNEIMNSKIILYGYSSWGKYIEKVLLDNYGVIPVCIIDNAKSKDIPGIYDSSKLMEYGADDTFIIVTTLIDNYKKICMDEETQPFLARNKICCIRETSL